MILGMRRMSQFARQLVIVVGDGDGVIHKSPADGQTKSVERFDSRVFFVVASCRVVAVLCFAFCYNWYHTDDNCVVYYSLLFTARSPKVEICHAQDICFCALLSFLSSLE